MTGSGRNDAAERGNRAARRCHVWGLSDSAPPPRRRHGLRPHRAAFSFLTLSSPFVHAAITGQGEAMGAASLAESTAAVTKSSGALQAPPWRGHHHHAHIDAAAQIPAPTVASPLLPPTRAYRLHCTLCDSSEQRCGLLLDSGVTFLPGM